MKEKMEKTAKTRKVAILAADGVDAAQLMVMKQALKQAGVLSHVISKFKGTIAGSDGQEIEVDRTFLTGASVMYDAVYIPGGKKSVEMLAGINHAVDFVHEAFKHGKAIAATGEGVELLKAANLKGVSLDTSSSNGRSPAEQGIVIGQDRAKLESVAQEFIGAIAMHRNWMRTQKEMVLA